MQFFKKYLRPAWTFKTEKKVWRLLPGTGVLAVELRDTDNKLTEFAALNIENGSPLWQNLQFEEKWWITVNKIHRDVLLLQQFVKPDMPTPGKIFAVDILAGKLLWQSNDLSFMNVIEDTVYGLRSTLASEEVVGVNYRSGQQLITFPLDDTRVQEVSEPAVENGYLLPVVYKEPEGAPDQVTFPNPGRAFPDDAKAPSFIESQPGKYVVGYYLDAGTDEKGAPVYDSHVKVIDVDGKVLYDDVADRKVYTTFQDFYFQVNEELLYVRNSNEIVAVRLD